MKITDLTFTEIDVPQPVRRVVSLLPSATETVFALGAGERLVGRTRYCIAPEGARAVENIGGTKDPDLARIIALKPELVIANKEENRREDILHLREHGLAVHVGQPTTVEESLYWVSTLGMLLQAQDAAEAIVKRGVKQIVALRDRASQLEEANAHRLKPRQHVRPRVVAFIWKDPWMAVGNDTYAGDLIETLGGEHVLKADKGRYPELTVEAVAALRPDVLLFPDEPFPFKAEHLEPWREHLRLPADRLRICDGQDFLWFGARTPEALQRLQALVAW